MAQPVCGQKQATNTLRSVRSLNLIITHEEVSFCAYCIALVPPPGGLNAVGRACGVAIIGRLCVLENPKAFY